MKEVKVSDFAEVITGGTPSTTVKEYWDGGKIPWLNSGELNKKYIYDSKNFITESGLKNSSTRMMPAETVLIALTGATCGLSALTKIDACANQSVSGILPSENHNPEYLFHYLRTQRQRILDKAWGNAQPHISQKFVKDLVIPLPSVEYQTHIAQLLNKAENLIAQRKESILLLDEFMKSTFLEMFGDPEHNRKGYPFTSLENLCSVIVDCPHSTPVKAKDKTNFPCIRTSELINGYISWESMQYLEEVEYEKRTQRLIPLDGDIVYGREGTYGEAIRIPSSHKFSLGQRTMLFRPDLKKTTSIFLWAMVRSEFVYRQAKKKNSGSTVGHVNVKDIKQFRILNPPLHLQNIFSQIVTQIEALKEQYKNSLQELENLYGALSQKAFKGELNFADQGNEQMRIAAETQAAYPNIKILPIPNNKKGFAKQVLGGKIVSLFREDKNFTSIKFQKLQYLAENIAEADLLWNYYRQQAGPYDNRFMHTVALMLKRNNWYDKKGSKYYPLNKATQIDGYYNNYFGSVDHKLSELFTLLKNATEKFCEAIATIFAVWNNHIILKKEFNVTDIKTEFFEWSSRKQNLFTPDEFERALNWMQKHDIVPTGFGKIIKEK